MGGPGDGKKSPAWLPPGQNPELIFSKNKRVSGVGTIFSSRVPEIRRKITDEVL